ncbi:MAG: hypothetical protein FWD71_18605 [Oscillospiraceae bacterium]|nr:hypothetical protein [Oscillospiraceae bacterium]
MEVQKSSKLRRNQKRSDERHKEYLDLTEKQIYDRAFRKPKSVEEIVMENLRIEQLARVIRSLPEPQKSRVYLHCVKELTYEQIAKHEQKQTAKEKPCSPRAVKYSIDIAIEKIKKFFDFFKD